MFAKRGRGRGYLSMGVTTCPITFPLLATFSSDKFPRMPLGILPAYFVVSLPDNA